MALRTTSAAANKRKRDIGVATSTCSPNKQRRQALASSPASANTSDPTSHVDHETESEAPSTQEWPARRILAETARKYLVEWEDSSQGERYAPTWEWKSGVGEGLVHDWKALQAAEEAARAQALLRKRGSGTKTRPVVRPSTPPSAGGRRRRGQTEKTPPHSLEGRRSSPFIDDSPSASGSESYLPSTQGFTASASTQQAASSGHGTATALPTQESSTWDASGTVDTTVQTTGSSTFVPTASSRETGNTTEPSQPAAAEETSQGIELPDGHSQTIEPQTREIPESPAQEEPPSFLQPIFHGPQAPATAWHLFQDLSSLEHVSTQEDSNGISRTQRSLPEFRWFGAYQTAERRLEPAEPAQSPTHTTSQAADQVNPLAGVEHANNEDAVLPLLTSAEPHTGCQVLQDGARGSITAYRDFALHPQEGSTFTFTSISTGEQSTRQVQEQHAQVVTYISTQEDSLADVHPTTEECESTDIEECNAATPKSRHDSSQGSPIRSQLLFLDIASGIPQPPSSSLQAVDSVPPPRPQTPITVSSLSQVSVMTARGTPELQQRLHEENEAMRKELEEALPLEPRPRFQTKSMLRRNQIRNEETERRASAEAGSTLPAAATTAPETTVTTPGPGTAAPEARAPDTRTSESVSTGEDTSHIKQAEPQPELSSVARTGNKSPEREGAGPAPQAPTILAPSAPTNAYTRSPSSIAASEPPSLRTEALINSAAVHVTELPSLRSHPHPVDVRPDAERPASGPEEVTNLSSDEDSVIGHDHHEEQDAELGLAMEEYMVPLPMRGFQRDATNQEIKKKKDLLEAFLDDVNQPDGKIEEIKSLLKRLKAIETHVDLYFAESHSQESEADEGKQYIWNASTSAKFVFLGSLLDELRDRAVHVIIVLKDNEEALFRLLEKALQIGKFNFKSPTRGKSANFSHVEGHLLVTLLTADSHNVVRPPDVIICIDSVGMAADIRKKGWARNPDRARAVPILDLMVPNSISHIDFCLTNDWDPKLRLHTSITTLSQLNEKSGRSPINTPQAEPAGQLVAQYIIDLQEPGEEAPVWPLPSIHSIKDVVETVEQNTQLTQEKFSTQPTPAPKRHLDDDQMQIDEPSKRPCLTAAQENVEHPPSNGADPMEIPHVTDSMPGTAVSPSNRRSQPQPTTTNNSEMELVPRGTLAELHRLRELERAWEPRQHEHEIVSSRYRELQQDFKKAQTELETAGRNKAVFNRRIDKLRDENSEWRKRFKELEGLTLMSEDEHIAEIARLLKSLHEAETTRDAAIRSKESTEKNFSYLRDQLGDAQNEATNWKRQYDEIAAKQPSLHALAHGQTKELKQIHYSARVGELEAEVRRLKDENAIQKKVLEKKDEEITKLKANGRGGYSTRQSSVPRSPRVGSRGGSRPGSPAPTGRDRVTHLRNG